VLAPQRSLLQPYRLRWSALTSLQQPPWLLTLGGLHAKWSTCFGRHFARRRFCSTCRAADFLTLETAQYYMARVVGPLIQEAGYFEGVRLPQPRIYSQILDNLNKAALVGFPHTEIGERLKSA